MTKRPKRRISGRAWLIMLAAAVLTILAHEGVSEHARAAHYARVVCRLYPETVVDPQLAHRLTDPAEPVVLFESASRNAVAFTRSSWCGPFCRGLLKHRDQVLLAIDDNLNEVYDEGDRLLSVTLSPDPAACVRPGSFRRPASDGGDPRRLLQAFMTAQTASLDDGCVRIEAVAEEQRPQDYLFLRSLRRDNSKIMTSRINLVEIETPRRETLLKARRLEFSPLGGFGDWNAPRASGLGLCPFGAETAAVLQPLATAP